MGTLQAVAVGVLTGVISSFAVWYFVTQRLSPNLSWVDHLEERSADGYTGYRARLENRGKRPVYDVEITSKIVIDRLVPGERRTYLAFAPRNLPVVLPTSSHEPGRVINVGPIFLDPAVLRRRQPFVPVELIDRLERYEHVALQDLLRLGEGGSVELTAYSRDVFSGARTLATVTLGLHDIQVSARPPVTEPNG